MKGWVYIISNKAMPGLVKVGHSMKDPELRAQEFDQAGLPYSYFVEYEIHVENPQQVEQRVHHILSPCKEKKEWFRCLCREAIDAIRDAAENKTIYEIDKRVSHEKAEGLPSEKEEDGKSEPPKRVLTLINKGKACEADGRYWDALFYYGEAEKASSNTLATKLRLELEQKIREESKRKGKERRR